MEKTKQEGKKQIAEQSNQQKWERIIDRWRAERKELEKAAYQRGLEAGRNDIEKLDYRDLLILRQYEFDLYNNANFDPRNVEVFWREHEWALPEDELCRDSYLVGWVHGVRDIYERLEDEIMVASRGRAEVNDDQKFIPF
jgi:hypothetical protein